MDENNVPQAPPDDDRTPTQQEEADSAQTPRGGAGWVMPEPVFRQSSGYLPKGFEQRVRAAVAEEQPAAAEPAIETAETEAVPGPLPEEESIAEQPDVGADPALEGVMAAPVSGSVPEAPVKKRRGFFRWLLIIVGVLLAIGAVAALVAVGIIWYFFQAGESQNF